jgi:hypothetical protein
MDPSEEIKQLYFKATPKTIDQDLDRAIDLLKAMPDEDARERLAVYMEGLAQMRSEARGGGGRGGPKPGGAKTGGKPGQKPGGPGHHGPRPERTVRAAGTGPAAGTRDTSAGPAKRRP